VIERPRSAPDHFDASARWLHENAHAYRGTWVALADGVLLGSDASRIALHRRLEQEGRLASATFVLLDDT